MSTTNLVFKIKIKPQSKQSVRYSKNKFYTDPIKKAYVNALKQELRRQFTNQLIDKPIALSVSFVFAHRNKKLWGTYKTTRPDLDNLLKPLKDALSETVIKDDSLICRYGNIEKKYGEFDLIEIRLDF